jgi:predicted DNA binding CopG/RHH family protein
MARPALLIGLGGTGQWVLTYVKKELLDYTKGEGVPPEVRLIAFDTTRQIDEKKSKPDKEDPIVVNGVHLDNKEFYHLGGNIEKTVREVAEKGLHPHISSWLQAKTYLATLSPGQYNLEDGAGQMRPFGRMAVFKDLEANPENSTIFGTIRDAIHDIRREVSEKRSLDISIIASLAGGTGAGMAIDVAHIIRTIAEDTIPSENFFIHGFFVLPRAFHLISGGDTAEMRARAFAAIRELSRFITVFGDREYPMIYNPHPQFREQLQKPVKKRLFDLCYLVDAHRSRNSLDDVDPRFGIFPSIADVLLSFLDEKSGQKHSEHVKNVLKDLTKKDDVAYFSAVGTYAFDLPIREIAEENACKMAIDFLDRLVKPERDDEGRVTKLSSTENREMIGKRGSDLVGHFMKEPGSIEGMGGTLFLSQAAGLLDQGGVRNNQLLEQVAGRSNMEWLTFMEPEDATEEIRDLRTEVRTILEHSLSQDVKASKELKEKPEFGHERIEREVEQYLVKYLGRKQPDGSTTGGKFREGLDRYTALQIGRFWKALGKYCVRLLNGTSDTEPESSKSGKLGFVQEFLDVLSRQIEAFCQFMEKVREIRQREKRLPIKQEEVKQARNQMYEDRKKKSLFKDHADIAQKQFIQLMEDQIELEKDELVFDYVHRIAIQYKNHSILLKETMDKWANALAIGTAEHSSLYEVLNTNMQQVRAKRQQAENFSRIRREETDDEFEKKLYQRFADKEIEGMFKSMAWSLSEDGKAIGLQILKEDLMQEKVRERDRPIEYNVKIILKKTRETFQRLIQEEMISKRLMDHYSEEDLAKELYEKGSPLANFNSSPRFGRPSNFLAVKHGVIEGDEPYFRKVVEIISELSGAGGERADLVQSLGTHKCTLIYTYDIINADCMSAYEDLSTAYRQFVDDRRLLHNFPAEVNAVNYEQQVHDKLLKAYHMFNPRIVFMLEYWDWVRQFTRCKVYDLVKLDKDEEGNQFWCLHLPKCEHKNKRYNAEKIELTLHVAKKADFLQAMDTFIFRKKDFRRDFDIPILYEHVVKALILAEEKIGDEAANIKKLEAIIESGFIRDFSTSDQSFERDLGDLMHVILKDEIDRLSGSE